MKNSIKNPKGIAILSATILLLAIIGTASYFKKSNAGIVSSLNDEKIKTEQLLSEKLILEKEIARMQGDLAKLGSTNSELNASLSKQLAIANTAKKSTGNSGAKTIKSLKKEIEALRNQKNSLNTELADARNRLKLMEGENGEMQKQIAMLTSNNKKLGEDLAMMKGIGADQFDMAAYKGKNEKLTVKAKKVNKLSTRFTVPSYVAANAGFKIKMPDGKIIDKTAKGMSMTIIEDIHETYASVDGVLPTETMKEIELTYTPDKKLKSGAYKVELYNGANYLTSCVINLK